MMEYRLLSLCFFLYLTLVGSYALESVDWESYWHSVLPNSEFPRALRNVLQSEGEAPYVPAGKVNKNVYGKAFNEEVQRYVPAGKVNKNVYGKDFNDEVQRYVPAGKVNKNVYGKAFDGKVQKYIPAGKVNKNVYGEVQRYVPAGKVNKNVYGKAFNEEVQRYVPAGKVNKNVYGKAFDGKVQRYVPAGKVNKNVYGKAVNEKVHQVSEAPGGELTDTFFLRKDLQDGQKVSLTSLKTQNDAKYLPRKVAESIPFSSKKLPEILNHFGIKPKSPEAKMVKTTIQECEEPSIKGEEKFCATSPESLIDFGVSKLGKQVQVYTMEVDKEAKPQEYRIDVKGVHKIGEKSVVCHKMNYMYGVFYCHEIQATLAFMVSLAGSNGTKAKAIALCHYDTKSWNPQHFAFQMLKVKPGTVPICHFLSRGNLVWVPN